MSNPGWTRLLGLVVVLAACSGEDGTDQASTTSTSVDDGPGTTRDAIGAAIILDDRCAEATASGVEAPAGFVVHLVTDVGTIDDGSFNQAAYEGMAAAEDCFGFQTSYVETSAADDETGNIAASLEGAPDLVVTVGYRGAADTLAAAEANPGVRFLGIDQFQTDFPANYVGIQFREDEGGCLAGVAAGLLTDSDVIGVVAGRQDVPPMVRYVNAYGSCATKVNPDVVVLSAYNEAFDTPDEGASDAEQFLAQGADVIFGAGGPTGSGAVVEATTRGAWGVGSDQDEYLSTFDHGSAAGADLLATSAVKRVDLAVFDTIVRVLDGSFAGGLYTLTAQNDGITYAPPHDADVPRSVLDELEKTRRALAAGTFDIGVDPVTGLPA